MHEVANTTKVFHKEKSFQHDKAANHARIFASMCPDEILDHYDNYETRVYHTTLMLGDVSGFTDVTERYTKSGKGGASKLTETLNSYLGAMVQEILSHKGDVLKFSGDAFIVMWKHQEGLNMRDLATTAMQTACSIQKHFGTYDTDVGVTLRVKLAIASGKTYFASVGDPKTMSHYIITGKPVWDVKKAEQLCKGGDILVAASCWQWANPNEYVHEIMPDGKHTLLLSSSNIWLNMKSSYSLRIDEERFNNEEEYDMVASSSRTSNSEEPPNHHYMLLSKLSMSNCHDESQVDFTLRPKLITMAKAHVRRALQSYMLRPVIRSVELNEPLEYLTEMRRVVIMFVNVVTVATEKKRLIKMVDAAYKLVCRIVGGMQGCVNKTSLFDKDLMFLCVFGLRGDKHELESQIGLRCAAKVKEGLCEMQYVKTVTVGVTTGVTYCGVIGHVLRREYTVIGIAVNKAARLMVAYTDKVVCDRESFLYSRLEGRHFKLQEPKELKGITDMGPVYEFIDQVRYKVSEFVWSKYPLLGRDNEMYIFGKLLANLIQYNRLKDNTPRPSYNTLVIKGEPRMGKTRLLDEMSLSIPSGVPSNYISLVSTDMQTPFTLIHLIFSVPLGFTKLSNPKEREDKLILFLGNIEHREYLCVLNQPFNVRFPWTAQYRILVDVERMKILQEFLMRLAINCFNEFWVILIDDAEYVDEESLYFLDILIDQDMILFVLNIGRKVGAEYRVPQNFLTRGQVIDLAGIDKWYHAGLVCQILNVCALSPELERLVQERSSGNPGWIESFLVSLMQGGDLMIVSVTKREAEEIGCVFPNVKMLTRTVDDNNVEKTDDIVTKSLNDKWEMYQMSFQNNRRSIFNQLEDVDSEAEEEISIAVCNILETGLTTVSDSSATVDVMVLKLFDALTPYDQFLLKCASVLGNIVNRKMLEHLTETSVRDTALAVRKLFEIRVFECGVGDFTDTRSPIIYSRDEHQRITNIGVACKCIGIAIPDDLVDMPKYAFCGLMRFKITLFRDTTYRLLTENQKMELHNKALKFLQQHTRRCLACGEGYFANLLGHTSVKKKPSIKIFDMSSILDSNKTFEDTMDAQRIRNLVTDKKKTVSYLKLCKRLERKPTRTFSNLDFSNCQCNLILLTVYTQIVEHCRGIGRKDKTLTAVLEFAEICIDTYNLVQARKLLEEAESLLQEMFDPKKDEMIIFPFLTGKIRTLEGRCYLEGGFICEAERTLYDAFNSLGYTFPKTNMMIDLKTLFQLQKLKLMLKCPKTFMFDSNQDLIQNYTNLMAYCLALMFDVFRAKGLQKHARLAAIWALNMARQHNDTFVLSVCYTNMLITAHIYHNVNIIDALEYESLNLYIQKKNAIEFQDVRTIAELYAGVFFSRWLKGEHEKAINIGLIGVRLGEMINSTFLQTLLLPRLVHLFAIMCRHSEILFFLKELEFVSRNDSDKAGRTWYYAMCIDVQLDTGLKVLSFRDCEKYHLKEGESLFSVRDAEAEKRYYLSMWLWCLRTENWEGSQMWSIKKTTSTCTTDEQAVASTITILKKIEGLLIIYVHYINGRNMKANSIMTEVRNAFGEVRKTMNMVKIAFPRFLLLKAYYYMVQNYNNTAKKYLRRAKKISLKMQNKMIYNWAKHCEEAWKGKLSSLQAELWVEQFKTVSPVEWDEVNAYDSKVISYTLPIPLNSI